MPPRLKPMLATPGPLPDGTGWSFEFKWDGARLLPATAGSRLRLLTRAGRDVTGSFPELVVLTEVLDGRQTALDAELVALDHRGRPSFARLQKRLGVGRPTADLLRHVPVALYVFDLVHLDGASITAAPYRERRDILAGLDLDLPGVLCVPPHVDGDRDATWAAAVEHGLEGVVAKRVDAGYHPGRRSKAWIKKVIPHVAEVVLCGWLPGRGRLAGSIGALVVGAYDRDNRLHYVGKVGGGLTGEQRRDLLEQLQPLRRAAAPIHAETRELAAASWVDPVLVAQIAYRELTAGSQLRHPVWRGLIDTAGPTRAYLDELR
ncbi:non-homologous end-joining DNA ligase [Actinoplanes sp. CA-030573]|uniref:non-homologous end-joining DNA ligase n=1 Tax=Actinoplanes sp. CA-030573 TaxID=3239898 RepID=UPI003D90F8D5